MSPETHLLCPGRQARAQIAHRSVTAAAENLQVELRMPGNFRRDNTEHQGKLLDRRQARDDTQRKTGPFAERRRWPVHSPPGLGQPEEPVAYLASVPIVFR